MNLLKIFIKKIAVFFNNIKLIIINKFFNKLFNFFFFVSKFY